MMDWRCQATLENTSAMQREKLEGGRRNRKHEEGGRIEAVHSLTRMKDNGRGNEQSNNERDSRWN